MSERGSHGGSVHNPGGVASVSVGLAHQRSVRGPRTEEVQDGLDEQQLVLQRAQQRSQTLTLGHGLMGHEHEQEEHELAEAHGEHMPLGLDQALLHEHAHEVMEERMMMMEEAERNKEGQAPGSTGMGSAPGDADGAAGGLNGGKKAALHKMRSKRRSQKTPMVKPWLCILPNGQTSTIQSDRYKLTTQLGIQMRDLRLLDPQMQSASPSAILCRDKAIVVNLEYVKAIITMDRVLVLNHQDASVALFVENLQARIANPTIGVAKGFPSTTDLQLAAMEAESAHAHGKGGKPSAAAAAARGGGVNGGGGDGFGGVGAGGGLGAISAQLPFELRVLEICLDEISNFFELLVTELEGAVSPVLESLTTKVTSPVLERLRRLKNRLVRLTTRVETIKEVLEKFLDDDEDMHDLNLTANHIADHPDEQHHAAGSPGMGPPGAPGAGPGTGGGGEGPGLGEAAGALVGGKPRGVLGMGQAAAWVHSSGDPGRLGGGGGGMSPFAGAQSQLDAPPPVPHTPHAMHSMSAKRVSTRSMVSSVSTDSSVMESEVAVVEMLLESYFIKLDHYYNKLQNLSEEIKDAEELVNIKLDQHRNQLISTDLILTAFTGSMAMVTTISGIFGMNLNNGMQTAEDVFNQVAIASCVGAFLLFLSFVFWAWRYGLLVFN